MTVPVAQIVFVPVKDSVKPEDSSSAEGKAFLELLAQQKSEFPAMVWGRAVDKGDTLDKTDTIGVALEVKPDGTGFPLSKLAPFTKSPARTIRVRADVLDFAANPVTEVAILPLLEDLSDAEIARQSELAGAFGKAILSAPAPVSAGVGETEGKMALHYKSSWAAGPPKNRMVMMIGWRNRENHMKATETAAFMGSLEPISAVAAVPAEEFDVTHFQFRKV